MRPQCAHKLQKAPMLTNRLTWVFGNILFTDKLTKAYTMKSHNQVKTEQALSLSRLIVWAGGQSALARGLNVDRQVVHQWIKRGRISAMMAIEAERETNGWITKEELRPDVTNWINENA